MSVVMVADTSVARAFSASCSRYRYLARSSALVADHAANARRAAATARSTSSTEDVDQAAAAAPHAVAAWSATSADERAKYLYRLQEALTARATEVSATITTDMGAPKKIAQAVQTGLPITTLGVYANLLSTYAFEEMVGNSLVVREPSRRRPG